MTRERFRELWAAWGGRRDASGHCLAGDVVAAMTYSAYPIPDDGDSIRFEDLTEDNFEEIAEAYGLTPPEER